MAGDRGRILSGCRSLGLKERSLGWIERLCFVLLVIDSGGLIEFNRVCAFATIDCADYLL